MNERSHVSLRRVAAPLFILLSLKEHRPPYAQSLHLIVFLKSMVTLSAS